MLICKEGISCLIFATAIFTSTVNDPLEVMGGVVGEGIKCGVVTCGGDGGEVVGKEKVLAVNLLVDEPFNLKWYV